MPLTPMTISTSNPTAPLSNAVSNVDAQNNVIWLDDGGP